MNGSNIKKYPHIGLPLERKHQSRLLKYILNPKAIEHHAFLPLIRREILTKSYKWKYDESGKKVRESKIKLRNISYATHFDAAIYSYYAYELSEKYEIFLKNESLENVVSAYRKIPCKDSKRNKCNIEIANEVFEFIKTKLATGEEVAVITFDIKGFFDNLDHKVIKQTWKKILSGKEMEKDVYAVYKSITNYSYISEDRLFDLFKDRIICDNATGPKERKVKSIQYMHDKKSLAFCRPSSIKEIRDAKLINSRPKSHKGKVGIPQGLPISAIIANVYMCMFDKEIACEINRFSGLYRRYSDDIIIVCPIQKGFFWKELVMNKITDVKLEIQPEKTNLFNFSLDQDKIICTHESKGKNKMLEYLGFSFDGNKKLLKQSGLGHYYYRMAKSVARSKRNAISIQNNTNGFTFKNQLLKRFSHIGSRKHEVLKRSNNKLSFVSYYEKKYSYGNYITYCRKASHVMKEPAIIGQLKRNKNKLKNHISKLDYDVNLILNKKKFAEIIKYKKIYSNYRKEH